MQHTRQRMLQHTGTHAEFVCTAIHTTRHTATHTATRYEFLEMQARLPLKILPIEGLQQTLQQILQHTLQHTLQRTLQRTLRSY